MMAVDWLHTDGIYVKDLARRIIPLRMLAGCTWTGSGYLNWDAILTNVANYGVKFVVFSWAHPNFPVYDAETHATMMFDVNNSSHRARLDSLADLCRAKGIYFGLNYHVSSTALGKRYNISGSVAQAQHLINVWTPVLQHFRNREVNEGVPILQMIKLMDEPHLDPPDPHERDLWNITVPALYQIKPETVMMLHTINSMRFGQSHLMPWYTPTDPDLLNLKTMNIIMDAGGWFSSYNPPPFNFDPFSETEKDSALAQLKDAFLKGKTATQLSVGAGCGISEYYNLAPTQAPQRLQIMTDLGRFFEQNRMIWMPFIADYQLNNNGLEVLNPTFPDTPYSDYWVPTGPTHILTVTSTPKGIPFAIQ